MTSEYKSSASMACTNWISLIFSISFTRALSGMGLASKMNFSKLTSFVPFFNSISKIPVPVFSGIITLILVEFIILKLKFLLLNFTFSISLDLNLPNSVTAVFLFPFFCVYLFICTNSVISTVLAQNYWLMYLTVLTYYYFFILI